MVDHLTATIGLIEDAWRKVLAFRALVIEDNPDLSELYSRTLTRGGLEVTAASSGAGAIERLRNDAFDLVVADLNLGPGLTGVDVCHHVRMEVSKTVPVVLLTAADDQKTVIAAFEAGADEFVTKPVNLGSLRVLCRELLEANEEERLRRRKARRAGVVNDATENPGSTAG